MERITRNYRLSTWLHQIWAYAFFTTLLLGSSTNLFSAPSDPWLDAWRLYVSHCLAPLASATNNSDGVDKQERQLGFVKVADVDTNFVQRDGSCVLASYAIVASYFTRLPLGSYFEGYAIALGSAPVEALAHREVRTLSVARATQGIRGPRS